MDFVLADVEPGRHAGLGRIHLLARRGGGGERVVGLDLGLPVIAVEPADRLPRGIGSAGILEVRKTRKRRLAECRELRADEIQVQVHERASLDGPGIITRRSDPVN